MNCRRNVKLSLTIFSLMPISFIAMEAFANSVVAARNITTLQIKQAKSIEGGLSIGRLTPKESRKLIKEQQEIIRIERDMRKDGVLSDFTPLLS